MQYVCAIFKMTLHGKKKKKKKLGWKGSVKDFSIDYNAIITSKIIFGIIKKMFIVLLTSCINTSSIVNASNHTKCVSANNQKCEI